MLTPDVNERLQKGLLIPVSKGALPAGLKDVSCCIQSDTAKETSFFE